MDPETKVALAERKRALQELEADAERAAGLESEVADLKEDLARIQHRHDTFAALGDGHVEVPQRSYHQGLHCDIEWEPIRSRQTGRELAASVEGDIEHLQGEIERREQEIERLLAAVS